MARIVQMKSEEASLPIPGSEEEVEEGGGEGGE